MPEFNVRETFEVIGKAKTREEKRDLLKQRENFATKAILQLNYHPSVKWFLPPGSPPYTPSTEGDMTSNSLHYEIKKMDYYTDPSPHDLPMLRRESMFVGLLERLDPKDAKLLIDVKDGKLSYKGLTYKLVKDTWPDLLPEEEVKQTIKEEVSVEQ
tara:strand:- start:669 stop:1136 length:468 start_codon:yes stop_codon:yes gene_type:complete